MLARVVKYSMWQLAAQVLSASTMVVLTALLPASPLATYGYALSISSLMCSFVTLRMEQAILVATSDDEAAALAWGSTFVAAAVMCAFVAYDQIYVSKFAMGSYTAGALSSFAMSMVTISQQVLIRKNQSSYAGRIAALRSLVVAVVVIMFAAFGYRSDAKSILNGLALASAAVTVGCLIELARTAKASLSVRSLKSTARSYSDVWLSYLGQSVLSGISLNAPYFAIFHFSEHRYAAAYLLADRIVRMPVTLLSSSVRSHLTHQFRMLLEMNDIKQGTHILMRWSAMLAVLGAIVLVLGGSTSLMVGHYLHEDKWRLAGFAVLAMTMWGASVMSNPPAAATLTVCRKTSYILKMQGVELGLRIAAIALAVIFSLSTHFYAGLFAIFIPGIIYNAALWLKAWREWGAYAFKNALLITN